MGNSSSSKVSSAAPKIDSADRKDDFMSDDSDDAPLIQSEKESERFVVEKNLMGIMVNRAESRVRVRQGRQLHDSAEFQTLLHRPERYMTGDASTGAVSSQITFVEPTTSLFSEPAPASPSSDSGAKENTSSESKSSAVSEEAPPALQAHTPVITLPMPPPVKVAQKEFDFSKESEHVPLRERLRVKRLEELKKKREREEAISAFAKANAAPEPALPSPPSTVEEPAPKAEVAADSKSEAVESASPPASPPTLVEPVAEASAPAVTEAEPTKPEEPPKPAPEPERKLHVTVPSLAITAQQSDRYDGIVTEAKVNIWDGTQKRLEALAKLESGLEKAEERMKLIRRLPLSTRCVSFEERMAECLRSAQSIENPEARRLACAADRESLLSCFKSQE